MFITTLLSSKTPFGLSLGGGGARGFAHIGVIAYLQEHDIAPKYIAGTSMGACIGAAYAMGMSAEEITESIQQFSYLDLLDIDITTGLIQGNKIRKVFKKIFGKKKLEDLPIPMKVAATNLNTGKLIMFESGSLVDILRATISIPGVFSPYHWKGTTYIDGGIRRNLPLEEFPCDTIIASSVAKDVSTKISERSKVLGLEIPRSWFALNKDVLTKSLNIMLLQQEDDALAKTKKDVILIRPSIKNISMFSIDQVDTAIALGYKTAKKILA